MKTRQCWRVQKRRQEFSGFVLLSVHVEGECQCGSQGFGKIFEMLSRCCESSNRVMTGACVVMTCVETGYVARARAHNTWSDCCVTRNIFQSSIAANGSVPPTTLSTADDGRGLIGAWQYSSATHFSVNIGVFGRPGGREQGLHFALASEFWTNLSSQ